MKFYKIGICGPIAAGKTSFCDCLLNTKPDEFCIERENLQNPFLSLFYQDPVKYAFMFQMYFVADRFESFYNRSSSSSSSSSQNIVWDRTFWEDPVFARLNNKLGNINELEYKVYCKVFGVMKK